MNLPGHGNSHYNRRRAAGDRYHPALRNLLNRMLGQLHHCLTTRQTYDETTAFASPTALQATIAA